MHTMINYGTRAPAPDSKSTQPWVFLASIAAISAGAICAVGVASSVTAPASLYTNVAPNTQTRPIVATQVSQRATSVATRYATVPTTGSEVHQGSTVITTHPIPSHATPAQPLSSTAAGVGAVFLLLGSVLYNFFKPSNNNKNSRLQPMPIPETLKSVVVPDKRTVKLDTRMVAPNTSYAMMTTTSRKEGPSSEFRMSPVFDETCEQTGITLSRYMLEVTRAHPEMIELESIFASIQTACKTISKLVNRSAIDGSIGYHEGGGSVNVQGEEQKKLDVITNEVLKKALRFTGRMGVIASEEEDKPMAVDNTNPYEASFEADILLEEGGGYISVFDPLDGSSNVDAGIPVGTIFGIFQEDEEGCLLPDDLEGLDINDLAMQECLKSTLKPGNHLVASGYALYSSGTHFVFTLGDGVNGFTLDHSIGEFVLTHPNIQIPPRGQIYSINEANRDNWDKPTQAFISSLADGSNRGGNKYSSRYIGSMVGDVHRTLLYGGVFGYPADTKNVNGKLRLLYEAAPMSFLLEQAGGKSTTGMVRCMDLVPTDVHQRVPLMMGGADEIDELEEWYEKLADDELRQSQEARLK